MVETLLFRHRVLFAGDEGELSVYPHHVSYISLSNANGHQNYSFVFIKTIKYFSKPDDREQRVMMMLELNDSSKAVFNLIGVAKEQCRMELERLRVVIADIRRGTLTNEQSTVPAPGPAPALSKTQKIVANANSSDNTSGSKHRQELDEARRQLLNADKELAKTYKDLVTVSQIFTDQEFWENHSLLPGQEAILDRRSHSSSGNSANLKPKVTNLLSDLDIVKDLKTGGTKFSINLTVEMKAEIFTLYPPVKKAFVAEVPVHLTEADFWLKFFQSEYYSRDKNYKSASRDGLSDDLFSRYAADLAMDGNKDRVGSGKSRERLKNVSSLVDDTCDLTLQEGDFHVKGSTDRENMSDAPEISKDIINKYNKHSSSFFATDDATKNHFGRKLNRDKDDGLSELQTAVQPAYIPLIVSRSDDQYAPSMCQEDGGSAFVKAASIVKKQAPKVEAEIDSANILTAISTGRAMERLFPDPSKAVQFIQNDISHKRSFTAVAKSAARKSGTWLEKDGPDGDLTVIDMVDTKKSKMQAVSAGAREGDELDRQFRDEMYERFNTVTELLRHLYSILSKEDPLTGPYLDKGVKITEKLESIREALDRKRARLGAGPAAVIDGVTDLIKRGESKWKKVTSTL